MTKKRFNKLRQALFTEMYLNFYKPEKLDGREIIEHCDMILDVNGIQLIIEPKSVGAGKDHKPKRIKAAG